MNAILEFSVPLSTLIRLGTPTKNNLMLSVIKHVKLKSCHTLNVAYNVNVVLCYD